MTQVKDSPISLTPRTMKMYDLFCYADARSADPDWKFMAMKIKEFIAPQSTIHPSIRAPFIEKLKTGCTLASALREFKLQYCQVKTLLAEIGWNSGWRLRDTSRKVGSLTRLEIKNMYEAEKGLPGTAAKIAVNAGVSDARIQQVLQEMGLSAKYSKASDHQAMIDMANAGLTAVEIAAKMGVELGAVTSQMSRLRRGGCLQYKPSKVRKVLVRTQQLKSEEPAQIS